MGSRTLFNKKSFLYPLLSGILLTLSFPKISWFPLAWVALVPLLLSLEGLGYRESFWVGWLTGISHFTSLLYWIYHVVNHYGKVPMPLGVVTLLLLTSYLSLFPAISCLVYKLLKRKWFFPPGIAMAVAWVSAEYGRGHLFSGFPWGLIGYSQIPWHTAVQSMDVFGVLGISFLLVFGNGVLHSFIRHGFNRKVALEVTVFLVLFSANYIYGIRRLHFVDKSMDFSESIKVGIVQGNIPQDLKWDREFQETTVRRYGELTKEAIETGHPSLVVWPETAVPFYFGVNIDMSLKVLKIAKRYGIYLLFGSPGLEYRNSQPHYYNWALLASPRGRITGVYAKEHLVPFGEYVPLKKLLFFVHRLAEGVGDFSAGSEQQKLFDIGGIKVGTLICYEVIFPELALKKRKLGSNLLVNISNDAWFGDTGAPYQHLEMAQARAIETRLPLVRCTNTGISAFIDAEGKIRGVIPLNNKGFLVKQVAIPALVSLYAVTGDILAGVCIWCSMLVLLYALYDKIRMDPRKRRNKWNLNLRAS